MPMRRPLVERMPRLCDPPLDVDGGGPSLLIRHAPYPLLRMYHRGYTFPLAIIFFTVQRQDILASSAIA